MLRRVLPEVGSWYENVEQGSLFEVVTLDEDDNLIAIQYFDGELEEIELDAFLQLPLRMAEQPEDWGGPFDVDLEDRDDNDYEPINEDYAGLADFSREDDIHIIEDF